jgi:hypothetical protein
MDLTIGVRFFRSATLRPFQKSLTCRTIRNDQDVVRAGRDFGLQLMATMAAPMERIPYES